MISGGFLNDLASKSDPKAFVYAFDGTAFPNVPLIQPRLGSVEEWRFVNNNNDEHPIHIHVNDFQITIISIRRPVLRPDRRCGASTTPTCPAPALGPERDVIQPGKLSAAYEFDDFIGFFVMHCHRLNHEDNGLMALINVIPAASTYAVAVPGSPGQAAQVKVYDGKATGWSPRSRRSRI